MEKPVTRPAKENPASASPDVRIKVANFGPIADAAVDLRPLTVFVGPGNAGKTYLAALIYALHKALEGFPRFPPVSRHICRAAKEIQAAGIAETISGLDKRPFFFSDLPETARKTAQRTLQQPDCLATELKEELERCFDLKDAADLIGSSAKTGKMDIVVENGGEELWNLSMGISRAGITADGRINDMVLVPEFIPADEGLVPRKGSSCNDKDEAVSCLAEILEMLPRCAERKEYPEIHCLPAGRNGVIQSHRAIASSLVAGATRANSERFPAPPTLSGVTADFLQRLILCDAADPRHRPRGKPSKALQDLADALERKTLDGRIMAIAETPGGYPEFVYKPRNAKKSMRLNRASSMASELAPLVLFLRNHVREGDTLVIEEPEAHLDPAAQTEMAAILAQLVRSGVRVVATTHSDWLLKALGNLMREGALGADEGRLLSPSSLQPRDVGAWLFRKDGTAGSTVEEIPFDRVEGIEPAEYEDIAERLYNRAADLQNGHERIAGGNRA